MSTFFRQTEAFAKKPFPRQPKTCVGSSVVGGGRNFAKVSIEYKIPVTYVIEKGSG
ncbi:hypothetical protein [Neisseria mucosa]|uniref:hypothetical protein n=1 Tax=Neisseria mucosa TaxID=488 RepID=UPI00280BCA09|nr:hypothetical protein [Neisseria mucosa]